MKTYTAKLVLVAALAWMFRACYKDVGPVEPELETDTEVSFSNDVQPIFNAYCIACHPSSGNLDLREGRSYSQLVNVPASGYPAIRVVPGDPEASVLYKKIDGSGAYGANMPTGGQLPSTDVQKIRLWIEQGAKNN
ncbi:MAG: hypothetical protein GXO27_05275 [Chlorobi bacterium]|nr:hypothetical protein [Chlorobiota bacterium]